MKPQKIDIFHSPRLAREDQKTIDQKELKPIPIPGRPRLELGRAVFFFRDERQKKKSIVNEWARTGKK